MKNRVFAVLMLLTFISCAAFAQNDDETKQARALLQAVDKAIGASKLQSIQYSGNGLYGFVGQNWAPQEDWPRAAMTYTRTIDFDSKSSKEDFALSEPKKGNTGGGNFRDVPTPTQLPVEGELRRSVLVNGNYAWSVDGTNVKPQPSEAEERGFEILLTPHG